MTSDPDDLTLTRAVTAGDTAAKELFAARFRDRLVYLAGKKGVPTADCEDVADETLITAFDQLSRGVFRGESSIGTWLEKILRGKAADFWRKGDNKVRRVSLDEGREGAGEEGPGAALVSAETDPVLRVMVQEILTRMSAKHRRVLLLNQVQGYTTEEIGKIVGWPAGTVGRVLASAKAKFKDLVLESEESGGERRLEE